MKIRNLVPFICISLWFNVSQAQNNLSPQSILSFGYGVGIWGGSVIISSGENPPDNVKATNGPYYLKYEKGISRNVGLGVNLSYGEFEISKRPAYFTYYYHDVYKTFSALVRMNFSLGKMEKADPYFGFGLGYRTGEHTDSLGNADPHHDYSVVSSPIGMEMTIGMRLYFTQKLGMYMELGFTKTLLQFGMTYSLKKKFKKVEGIK